MIQLPLVNGHEVIPLRLVPFVTIPALTKEFLLEHLSNPRGDFYPELHARNAAAPNSVIKAADWYNMYARGEFGFPAGRYVRLKYFEAYCRRTGLVVDGEPVKIHLSNQVPENDLKEALQGFVLKPAPKSKHVIKTSERNTKGLSVIQTAVNTFLDVAPGGYKDGFYSFLKAKIKLTTEEILKDGESYTYFFKSISNSGSNEGVYLNHPKEGKKEGEAGYNHYSGRDISSLISRERGKRNKIVD